MAFEKPGPSRRLTESELEAAIYDSDSERFDLNDSSDGWEPSEGGECSEMEDNLSVVKDSQSNDDEPANVAIHSQSMWSKDLKVK